ncbi:MAG: hypothetical protein WC614_10855 [bacterium]
MVWLKLEKKEQEQWKEAVMVDGYAPDFTYYKRLNLSALQKLYVKNLDSITHKKTYLINHSHYLEKTLPTLLEQKFLPEKEEILIFARLMRIMRDSSCPLLGSQLKCTYNYYTSGENPYSLEKRLQKLPAVNKHANVLKTEYEHDRENRKKRYIQNVIVHKTTSDTECLGIDKCLKKCFSELNFRVKEKGEYFFELHKNFTKACYDVLHYKLEVGNSF